VTGSVAQNELWGGGIQIVRSDAEVDGNWITGNQATLGGGLYVEGDSGSPTAFAPVITNNVISGNAAASAAGAMAVYYGGPGWKLRHNTIADNTSAGATGGVQIVASQSIEISSNVVSGNTGASAIVADGFAISDAPGLVLDHNDVHGNANGNWSAPDPTGSNGNISLPPGYANAGAGDYSPALGSPLVDAGADPASPPRDEAGRPRPLEGDGLAPSRADIGALERVVADADGDGVPNATDKCPYVADPAQSDSDGDGAGDLCDACQGAGARDSDRDGVCDREIFNLGNPANECSIRELAERLSAIYESLVRRSARYRAPRLEAQDAAGHYGAGYQDIVRRRPSIAKARRLLHWEPRVGLDAALERTFRAFLEEWPAAEAEPVRDAPAPRARSTRRAPASRSRTHA